MSTEKVKVSVRKHIDSADITHANYESNVQKDDAGDLTIKFNILINTRRELFLKLINKILENAKLPSITKLTEFIDVERDILVQDNVVNIINSMENELYMFFTKNASSNKKDSKK